MSSHLSLQSSGHLPSNHTASPYLSSSTPAALCTNLPPFTSSHSGLLAACPRDVSLMHNYTLPLSVYLPHYWQSRKRNDVVCNQVNVEKCDIFCVVLCCVELKVTLTGFCWHSTGRSDATLLTVTVHDAQWWRAVLFKPRYDQIILRLMIFVKSFFLNMVFNNKSRDYLPRAWVRVAACVFHQGAFLLHSIVQMRRFVPKRPAEQTAQLWKTLLQKKPTIQQALMCECVWEGLMRGLCPLTSLIIEQFNDDSALALSTTSQLHWEMGRTCYSMVVLFQTDITMTGQRIQVKDKLIVERNRRRCIFQHDSSWPCEWSWNKPPHTQCTWFSSSYCFHTYLVL